MAGDIEAVKKGASPEHKSVIIETTIAKPNTLPEFTPKPVFPKIPIQSLKNGPSLPETENIKPFKESLDSPRPLSKTPPPPFNTPLSKPIIPTMPPEPKNMAPPLDLPTAPTPLPIPPQPLTPPPSPRSMPTQPPIPPRPTLPPLPPAARATPSLPPLPPLPSKASAYPLRNGSQKKLFLLIGLGAAVVIFIIGEIWWFFLRSPSTPSETVSDQTDLLPPPQELTPLLPAEETQSTLQEPVNPPGLLSYDRTEEITQVIESKTATVGPDELTRLTIKIPAGTLEPVTLDQIIQQLGLKIPLAVKQNLGDNFDLFIFGGNTFDEDECGRVKNTSPQCWGPRLGLVLKVADPVRIKPALSAWEKTMASDLRPLVVAKTGTSASPVFLTGDYQGETIHYKNMPINTMTVEYALINDILVIATSKSSMLKAIDSINSTNDYPDGTSTTE